MIVLQTSPEYIKAQTARQLMEFAIVSYNADWTVIRNDMDHPSSRVTTRWRVGTGHYSNVQPTVRFLPITPQLCLEIICDTHKNEPKRHCPRKEAVNKPRRAC